MQIEVMPYKSSPFHLDSGRGLAIECDNVGKVIRKLNPQFLVVLNSCFTTKKAVATVHTGAEKYVKLVQNLLWRKTPIFRLGGDQES